MDNVIHTGKMLLHSPHRWVGCGSPWAGNGTYSGRDLAYEVVGWGMLCGWGGGRQPQPRIVSRDRGHD